MPPVSRAPETPTGLCLLWREGKKARHVEKGGRFARKRLVCLLRGYERSGACSRCRVKEGGDLLRGQGRRFGEGTPRGGGTACVEMIRYGNRSPLQKKKEVPTGRGTIVNGKEVSLSGES